MEFAPPPHNRLILPATRGCGPIELARRTGSDDHGPPRLGIGSRPNRSTATPQAAGHRIKSLEAAEDSAAARAQTVWARPQTLSPTSRTRWRRPACIFPRPIAHAASDREGAERFRSKARDPRANYTARRYPRVLCIGWFCGLSHWAAEATPSVADSSVSWMLTITMSAVGLLLTRASGLLPLMT